MLAPMVDVLVQDGDALVVVLWMWVAVGVRVVVIIFCLLWVLVVELVLTGCCVGEVWVVMVVVATFFSGGRMWAGASLIRWWDGCICGGCGACNGSG